MGRFDFSSCLLEHHHERNLTTARQYAVHSHPKLHDKVLSPDQIAEAIIPLSPCAGEETLRTEDILAVLEEHRDTVCLLFPKAFSSCSDSSGQIAVVWLPLVQYYTGQLLDIPPLATRTHQIGALIGLDMAHGIGNVEVKLNEWEVDFAVWCTYKWVSRH